MAGYFSLPFPTVLAVTPLILLAQGSSLPQPDKNGNYMRTTHPYWKIVATKPVNCRLARSLNNVEGKKVPPVSIQELPLGIKLQPGETIMTNTSQKRGEPAIVMDTNGNPWVRVWHGYDTCLVRAHRNFVRPIPNPFSPPRR